MPNLVHETHDQTGKEKALTFLVCEKCQVSVLQVEGMEEWICDLS